MKIQRILVPVDFSACADNALRYAAAFAAAISGEAGSAPTLHVVHCYDTPVTVVPGSDILVTMPDFEMEKELHAELQERLNTLTAKMAKQSIVFTSVLIRDQNVWDYVEANPTQADMVVMGTRGHTSLMHGVLFGTNTERTIRHSKVPVLTVPHGRKFKRPARLLLATGLEPGIEGNFAEAVALARRFDAQLDVAMISTPDMYATTAVAQKKYAELKQHHPYDKCLLLTYNAGSLTDGLREIASFRKSDLIVMFTHGRSGLRRLLYGSLTEEVAAGLSIPLIAFKYSVKHIIPPHSI